MLVEFQQTTQCYIPEDRILYNHRCEDLLHIKYYVMWYNVGNILSDYTVSSSETVIYIVNAMRTSDLM
jgi:hypothetical protein